MNILELFPPVRTFIFEVDHVLTDGHISLGTDNQAMRSFFARDLYAIHKAIQQGYQVSVITPELSGILLPVAITQSGITVLDSREHLPAIAGNTGVLYMNSIYPTPQATQPGTLYCCPADAVPEVKALARYISPFKGGKGCVYDVIEKVLKLNHHW